MALPFLIQSTWYARNKFLGHPAPLGKEEHEKRGQHARDRKIGAIEALVPSQQCQCEEDRNIVAP